MQQRLEVKRLQEKYMNTYRNHSRGKISDKSARLKYNKLYKEVMEFERENVLLPGSYDKVLSLKKNIKKDLRGFK